MRSQKVPYWADKETGGESEDESRSGSELGSEDNEEGGARGGTSGSVPLWPQSYWQSMDMYSTLQSPSISLFSPGLHHCLSSSHLASSYQKLPSDLRDGPTVGTQPLSIPFLQDQDKKEDYVLPYSNPVRKLEDQFVTSDSVYVVKKPETSGSSFLQGLFNGMNVLAGVGVLTTLYALKETALCVSKLENYNQSLRTITKLEQMSSRSQMRT